MTHYQLNQNDNGTDNNNNNNSNNNNNLIYKVSRDISGETNRMAIPIIQCRQLCTTFDRHLTDFVSMQFKQTLILC